MDSQVERPEPEPDQGACSAHQAIDEVLPTALTPRQRVVARLLAQGLRNEEIANELVLSKGTVANHVAAILDRLGLKARSQVATWATLHGLHGGQDRLLVTLERLLEIQPASLEQAMDEVATVLAEVLGTDKVDAFLHDPQTATLVAVGASNTPMSHRQRALGLDRQPLANGGRAVAIFQTGRPHMHGRVDEDPEELPGIKQALGVRSQLGVALDIAGVRRGVLVAQSARPAFFQARDLGFLQAVSRWVGSVAQRAELTERATASAREQGRRLVAEELVTVLAHDLRNAITPLRARIELLARRAAREQHTANSEDAQKLRADVDRLTRLIADLLDSARLDQGLLQLSPHPVDLVAMVHELAEALGTPQVTIGVQAPPELVVMADPARLRQALENVLVNAVQHSPDGARVRVELGVEEQAGARQASVTITDQGAGIEPDLLSRVFERFAKGPGSAGLGLGLHLAQQIALAHGGTLAVASSPGAGATFRLRLPTDGGTSQERHGETAAGALAHATRDRG